MESGSNLHEDDNGLDESFGMGEAPLGPQARDVARHVNGRVRDETENIYASIKGHGDVAARDLRVRDADQPGYLKLYIRSRELGENHKVITTIAVSTIAVGAMLTAVKVFRYKRGS